MSRTDVHNPNWVKQRDPIWRRHFHDTHNHTNGQPCDLPAYLADPTKRWSGYRCHRTLWPVGRNILCGCPVCGGGGKWRRREHRRDRRTGQQEARNWWRED